MVGVEGYDGVGPLSTALFAGTFKLEKHSIINRPSTSSAFHKKCLKVYSKISKAAVICFQAQD